MKTQDILFLIKTLPEKAPEIIKELNPVTWFERIINEGHKYKLAKAEIERKYEKDRDELTLRLTELNVRKEAYLASLNHQIKVIDAEDAPTMTALKGYFHTLRDINKQSDEVYSKILNSVGQIDREYFTALLGAHTKVFNDRAQVYKEIADTLDRHNQEIGKQREVIHIQILQHTKAIKDI